MKSAGPSIRQKIFTMSNSGGKEREQYRNVRMTSQDKPAIVLQLVAVINCVHCHRNSTVTPIVCTVTVTLQEGTGLGLPLAKSLIELHGGSLDIASSPGVGTTVSIRLPRERVLGPAA
jgi:nitrogen fixation/metabolism regulation signal transduction histidine kinase